MNTTVRRLRNFVNFQRTNARSQSKTFRKYNLSQKARAVGEMNVVGRRGLAFESWKGMTLWHWNVLIWKRYIRVERNVQENDVVLDVTEFLPDTG